MIRTRRAALEQSGNRFSEKIMLKQRDGIMMRLHHDLIFFGRVRVNAFSRFESETFIYFTHSHVRVIFLARNLMSEAIVLQRRNNILLAASIPACARNYSSQTGVRHEWAARRGKTKKSLCGV
jgi:hypothetical protein